MSVMSVCITNVGPRGCVGLPETAGPRGCGRLPAQEERGQVGCEGGVAACRRRPVLRSWWKQQASFWQSGPRGHRPSALAGRTRPHSKPGPRGSVGGLRGPAWSGLCCRNGAPAPGGRRRCREGGPDGAPRAPHPLLLLQPRLCLLGVCLSVHEEQHCGALRSGAGRP